MARSLRHAAKPRGKRVVHRSERGGGTMTLDTQSLASLSNDARQAVTAAFDALVHWRNEMSAANERCLTQVLDRVTDAHRALGWPEQVTVAAKEHFLKASKMQSHMIEQAMDVWQQQLKSQKPRSSVPGFTFQVPATSQFTMPVSEMMRFGEMTLAPYKLWIEVAETWQRNWMAAMSGGALPEPSSMTNAPFAQGWKSQRGESTPSRS
jgi:hypothetical protein